MQDSVPMPRQLFIHAGMPKTATTAIQETLRASQTSELSVSLWYPEKFPHPAEPFHRFLVQELRANARMLDTELIFDEARARDLPKVVLSCEGIGAHFGVLKEERLTEFRGLTHDFETTLIFCKRDFEEWSMSMYAQCLLSPPLVDDAEKSSLESFYGSAATFDEFRDAMGSEGFDDQENLSDLLATGLGAQKKKVFNFGKESSNQILKTIGVPLPEAVLIPIENTSVPFDQTEKLRKINGSNLSSEAKQALKGALARRLGVKSRVVELHSKKVGRLKEHLFRLQTGF